MHHIIVNLSIVGSFLYIYIYMCTYLDTPINTVLRMQSFSLRCSEPSSASLMAVFIPFRKTSFIKCTKITRVARGGAKPQH